MQVLTLGELQTACCLGVSSLSESNRITKNAFNLSNLLEQKPI